MGKIILIAYLVIGVLVAVAQKYAGDIGSIGDVVNLVLAVLLWPLLLVGVDFNLKIGGDDGNKKKGLLLLGPAVLYARAVAGSARRYIVLPRKRERAAGS